VAARVTGAGPPRRFTRRRVLALGLGAAGVVATAGVGGLELVDHGVLPGKSLLDQIDGACSVGSPPLEYSPLGPSTSGTFNSTARGREVGYEIGFPPGYRRGDVIPLVVMLHGWGGTHRDALVGMSPAQAVALKVDGRPLPPMAMVTVDGGNGYWNAHPGDNPMAMVVDELVPLCQRLGLGRAPQRVGLMGISMGGYGAILIAERYPDRFAAVAAISPAIWTSWAEADAANPTAYASAADFTADDAVTHTAALEGLPVRVAAGNGDPFLPGVRALAAALPRGAVVYIGAGCHTSPFFVEQEPLAMAFLGEHLTR
jgi:pimeloyl-ACP methyl ester carboxylesterase